MKTNIFSRIPLFVLTVLVMASCGQDLSANDENGGASKSREQKKTERANRMERTDTSEVAKY